MQPLDASTSMPSEGGEDVSTFGTYEVHLMRGRGRHPWYLRLVNRLNGEVVATSEGYLTKWNAKRASRKNFSQYPLLDKTDKPYKRFGAGS